MIIPIETIVMRLLTASNNQSLNDLPIQITSIDVEVAMNPNHAMSAQIIPVNSAEVLIYIEPDTRIYMTESAEAVMMLTMKFQII